jgi:hypothetical protein
MQIIRQGDILLRKLESVPKGRVYEEVKDKVVAVGEATGHNHKIQGQKSRVLRDSGSGQLLVELQEAAELVHEEHGLIHLEPGVFEVLRQREYNPIENRMVND